MKNKALFRKSLKKNGILYLFLLPMIIYILIFNYMPLAGLQIAFKDFVATKGIWGSEWVGFKYFQQFFSSPMFWKLLKNTLVISLYSLVVGFPIPILLALMINSVKGTRFKKLTQTVTYMPHFISTVILVGMMSVFLSPRSGFLNHLIAMLAARTTCITWEMQPSFPIFMYGPASGRIWAGAPSFIWQLFPAWTRSSMRRPWWTAPAS